MDASTSPTISHPIDDKRKQSPPAFLDLADSAGRLGSNMSEVTARVELKRMEHERQRALHRRLFEDQMRALEQQQAQELLSLPAESLLSGGSSLQHLAASAPTTPPRVTAMLNGEISPLIGNSNLRSSTLDVDSLSKAVGTAVSDKRKSVTYASSVNRSPDLQAPSTGQTYGRGAKSMPASRRTSASEHDEELAGHLQGLSLIGERNRASPHPEQRSISRPYNPVNAGMMLDEQLDMEMHSKHQPLSLLHLPTSDDDKFTPSHFAKLSTSSAALDLAPLSQNTRNRDKSSEWPQFPPSRGVDTLHRPDRRVTTPSLNLANDISLASKLNSVSATTTPLLSQHQQTLSYLQAPGSRRGSPPGLSDGLPSINAPRSVPTTPNPVISHTPSHLMKAPGTPLSAESQGLSGRLSSAGTHPIGDLSGGDLRPSLSRLSSQFDGASLNFNGLQAAGLDDGLRQQYVVDPVYNLNDDLGDEQYGYGLDANARLNGSIGNSGGSAALYHHNGTRYGLGLPGRVTGADTKMNGLHGPKHKRGDVDLNRFAGTRLEDLVGEIASLCKDQHGCRYLQKKLEEGVPEHRDIIFRETFTHFADLMTDPFGNYLCQKLLEYASDEQRNLICDSVASDLVNISLNMHGTRAVQKMIDFLATGRQTNPHCAAQIHSIIVALSLHVVVLIKDLNGNHVIQKCLNKLAPDDNQFIYNAVAANCVEVATHRHGCCVLQRCIDHASDHQRVQLVNEITYNALTLVQDPYGNYVVQYILDLNDNRFSDAVIRQFTGNVCALSVQKFSSNVIEKCIRVAEHGTRKLLIGEMLNRSRLEKLLRDSYGNYCVQTALDYADASQRGLLVEGIRPVLPLIRNTPYGKRIQNKLQREQLDGFGSSSGHYSHQAALLNMGLGAQGVSLPGRGLPQSHSLADVYNSQGGIYSLPTTQSLHSQSLHSLPSIDGYVLQNNSSHNHSLTHNGAGGFSNGGFSSANSFPNIGLASTLGDPYSRSNFGGYGL
ncbi:ARM repeat-containing protein [Thelephora ganbajun]|uniref:ARM repeat-containing protein n=1 Tax=Thelephora ganbajun TaxID=370292 RepID=A0ACB6ZXU4_THEGA|nr:ARM repeat-containing protein [Thelephora ganbajun]